MPDSFSEDTALISEIFSSLQGEGICLGERHLFIRFAGCDVGCVYCDEHAKPGCEMSLKDVLAEVERLERSEGPHSFVSLTGGEPLLHGPFLERLLPELHAKGLKVLLETNGTRWKELQEIIGVCDVISMDLKLASVGGHRKFLEEHRKFLKIACVKDVYIKILISKEIDPDEFDRHVKMIVETAPQTPVFIQPVWQERAELSELLTGLIQRAREQLRDVRLGIQVHKMLNIR